MNHSASSTSHPSVPEELWWQSVTLAELERVDAVINSYIQQSTESAEQTIRQFGRAVALRVLCIDAEGLNMLMAWANTGSDTCLPESQMDAAGQKIDLFEAWLVRRRNIGRGLEACTVLLPNRLRQAAEEKIKRFISETREYERRHSEGGYHRGLTEPVEPLPLIKLRHPPS